MNVSDAVRKAIPIARIKEKHSITTDDGVVVEAAALSIPDQFSVLLLADSAYLRAASKEEIELAGYSYEGSCKVTLGSTLASAARVGLRSSR